MAALILHVYTCPDWAVIGVLDAAWGAIPHNADHACPQCNAGFICWGSKRRPVSANMGDLAELGLSAVREQGCVSLGMQVPMHASAQASRHASGDRSMFQKNQARFVISEDKREQPSKIKARKSG